VIAPACEPQTTVRDEEGPYNLDGLWKSELTLAHFPVAEVDSEERRQRWLSCVAEPGRARPLVSAFTSRTDMGWSPFR
jgi:hypothetical protein